MKKIGILLFAFLILSCTSEDSNDLLKKVGGYYKVISVKSDTSLDLNNDGIINNDFYLEIIPFYDFESPDKYMEIRPTTIQNNNAQLIDFRFPHQHIDYLSDDTPFLAEYLKSFINYSYEINGNKIELINNYLEEVEEVGQVLTLEILENDYLKAAITKNIFDFKTKQWSKVNLEVEYLKVKN